MNGTLFFVLVIRNFGRDRSRPRPLNILFPLNSQDSMLEIMLVRQVVTGPTFYCRKSYKFLSMS
jgi:hypothetical protein